MPTCTSGPRANRGPWEERGPGGRRRRGAGAQKPRPPETQGQRGQKRGAAGHGRRCGQGLARAEQVVEFGAEELACPECGIPYVPVPGMFAESKVVDWLVLLVSTVYRRQKYRRGCSCADQPQFRTAPAPAKVVARSGYSAQFLARLCVEKFDLARPANKICESLALEGVHLAPGTLVGLYAEAWTLLGPLVEAIYAYVRQQRWAHCDETGFGVVNAAQQRERWWVWVLAAAGAVAFLAHRHRGAEVLLQHNGWDQHAPPSPVVTLLTDALSTDASRALASCIIQALCWAHWRRRVRDAGRSYPDLGAWAEQWRQRIVRLYQLHRARRRAESGSLEWQAADAALRAQVERMRQDMEAELGQRNLHSAQRGALEHLRKRWAGYTRFLDDPALPLDNNLAERLLRRPVLCRKNSRLIGAQWAAYFAAGLWSVLETARCNGLNVLTYFRAYFQACAEHGGKPLAGADLARFLPWALAAADTAAWSVATPVVLPAALTFPPGPEAATEPTLTSRPAAPPASPLPEAAAAGHPTDSTPATPAPGPAAATQAAAPGHGPATAEPPAPQAAAIIRPVAASAAAQAVTTRPAYPRARSTSAQTSPPPPPRRAPASTLLAVDSP